MVHDQHAAHRADAGVGVGRVRHVVCALGGIPADAANEPSALDAHVRRHAVRRRCAGAGMVRARTDHRPFVRSQRGYWKRASTWHVSWN